MIPKPSLSDRIIDRIIDSAWTAGTICGWIAAIAIWSAIAYAIVKLIRYLGIL